MALDAMMEQTMRWMGPSDPVSLATLRQAGCAGVVTALGIKTGEVWPREAILERKALIEAAGMRWSVVESVPVHESIKLGVEPARSGYIANYKETLRNLGACGVDIVAYNFMPVVDWTRTDLEYAWGDGSLALAFDALDFVALDCFGLRRAGAAGTYDAATVDAARGRWATLSEAQRDALAKTVIRGLPGQMTTDCADDLEGFRRLLARYDGVDAAAARGHLAHFVKEVAPVADEAGILLAIHPDDPPVPLLGLPRVVSTAADLRFILAASDAKSNGLCFCAGSLASREDNDVAKMVEDFKDRIHFVHLRNVKRGAAVRSADGHKIATFVESDHLDGDVPVFDVVKTLLAEKQGRGGAPDNYARLPFRPDHGHQMCDDLAKSESNPGYTAIGRLRGLAELRGLQLAILSQDNAGAAPAAKKARRGA